MPFRKSKTSDSRGSRYVLAVARQDRSNDLGGAPAVVLAGVALLETRHDRAHGVQAVGEPAADEVRELGVVELRGKIPHQDGTLGGILGDEVLTTGGAGVALRLLALLRLALRERDDLGVVQLRNAALDAEIRDRGEQARSTYTVGMSRAFMAACRSTRSIASVAIRGHLALPTASCGRRVPLNVWS